MQDVWQPTCSIELLRLRAKVLENIRQFFSARAVLEVETPLLGNSCGTDPELDYFSTEYHSPPHQPTLFLQTSPEFSMKRLLAAGSGSIYQICKAFRNGEYGRFHNPEFTLLEWYRVDFGLSELMDEIAELMITLFDGHKTLGPTQRFSYQELFQLQTGLNPLIFSYQDYCSYAVENRLPEAVNICGHDHAAWLDLIFSHVIQPKLGENSVCMVYGYPACQSSLARINSNDSLITERVEVFINGIELGNGYYELADAEEQERRFVREIAIRQQRNRPIPVKDERLVAALRAGFPDCSGMAIGLDRLLMLLAKRSTIDEVVSFPIQRA